MKKILFLAYTYPPDSRSGTFRILHFANEIAERGTYKPFVVTVNDKYYEKDASIDHELAEHIHSNISVLRTRTIQLRDFVLSIKNTRQSDINTKLQIDNNSPDTSIKANNRWQKFKDIITEEILAFPDRQIGWLPFAVYVGFKTIKKEKIDIIYATGSPWTSFCAGALLKLLTNVPLVIDYRDPWTDNPFMDTKLTKWFCSCSRFLERKIAEYADAIISNTYTFQKTLTLRYPWKKSLYAVHNGYSQKDIEHISLNESSRDSSEFILTYAGALYGHRTIDNFLYAFKELIAREDLLPTLRLHLIGVDENVKFVCENILGKELVQKHCYIVGRLPHKQCLQHLMRSQCLLVFQQGTKNQIPRKIFEYMAIKKPILAVVDGDGETANLVKRHSCGITVNDNCSDISSAIEEIFHNYDRFIKVINSQNSSNLYEVKQLSMQVEKILDETILSAR